MKKYQCLCCGYYTLTEEPPGSYEICKVCYWEDDYINNIDDGGGPNDGISLREARKNYKNFGAFNIKYINKVRPPLEDEIRGEIK